MKLSLFLTFQDYGSMTACLLKPALYVLQCLNTEKSGNGSSGRKGSDGKNGAHSNNGASNNGASNNGASNNGAGNTKRC
jgi:hypothetical protein